MYLPAAIPPISNFYKKKIFYLDVHMCINTFIQYNTILHYYVIVQLYGFYNYKGTHNKNYQDMVIFSFYSNTLIVVGWHFSTMNVDYGSLFELILVCGLLFSI